jgi:hypothetical protein
MAADRIQYANDEVMYNSDPKFSFLFLVIYEGWNFNSGNYLFTTDTK